MQNTACERKTSLTSGTRGPPPTWGPPPPCEQALRLLKRAGVQAQDMLKVYRCNVRSILEYALQKWQNIPVYLSERIEFVQKRTFKIIYPDSSYNQALILTKETTLSSRREFLWLILTRTVTTHYHSWCPRLKI